MIRFLTFFQLPEFHEAHRPVKFINNPDAGSPASVLLAELLLSLSAQEAAL